MSKKHKKKKVKLEVKRQELTSEFATRKTFSYKKGNVNLSFQLDIDNVVEMNDFFDLLVGASKDVSKQISERVGSIEAEFKKLNKTP